MGVQKILPLLLYICILSFYIYTSKCSKKNNENIRNNQELSARVTPEVKVMGQYRRYFFTLWNFLLQIIFVSIASLDEISKLLGFPSSLQKLLGKTRAYLFNALIFPCSLLVISTFWSIWHIDRELIFPKAVDEFFPSWINHSLHTVIGVPLLLELLLPKKDNFISFKAAAPALLLFCGVYQTFYFHIYFRDGVWLYPVYKALDWPQRFVFNIVQVAFILIFQWIGLTIQNRKISEAKKRKIH